MKLDIAAARRHPRATNGQYSRRSSNPLRERLTFRLTADERTELQDLARARGVSTSNAIRKAVVAYIKSENRRAAGLR